MAKQAIIQAKTSSLLQRIGAWLLGLFLLLLLLGALLVRVSMQWLPDVVQWMETELHEQLGVTLEIEQLQGHVEGFFPVIELTGLAFIPEDDGATPLSVDAANITFNPWRSLWRWRPQIEQLRLTGARLHLVMDDTGRVRLRGQDNQPLGAGLDEKQWRQLLDIAYEQRSVVLDDISVRFDFPHQPSLETKDAQLALVKQQGQRQLAVSFSADNHTLQFHARIHLQKKAYGYEELAGALYMHVEGERFERWLPTQWPLDLVPARISGKLDVWGELTDGGLAEATVSLSQGELSIMHRQEAGYWTLEDASLLLQASKAPAGYALQLETINGTNETAGRLSAGPVWAELSTDPLDKAAWQVWGENISLSALANHLHAWPFTLPEPVTRVLEMAPKGEFVAVHAAGEGKQWQAASAQFQEVALGQEGDKAQVAGLSGWLRATPEAGVLRLLSTELELGLPTLFEEPLAAQVKGDLHWQQQDNALWLSSNKIQLRNDDAIGEALLKLHWPKGETPHLQLRGEVTQGRISRAAAYIPLQKIPETARQWLAQAFVGGEVERGRFLYEGSTQPDPKQPWQRRFLMAFSAHNAELHLAPHWPNMTQISGEVSLDGPAVRGRNLAAHYLGQDIHQAAFTIIPDPERTQLVAKGHFSGEAEALEQLFTQTPLREQVPEGLKQWQVQSGKAQGQLTLNIPLAPKAAPLAVEVDTRFSQLDYVSEPLKLAATGLTGEATFSLHEGLQIPQFTGRLFDQLITGRITSGKKSTQVVVSGVMPMKALRQWQSLPWLENNLWGETGYLFSLHIPRTGENNVAWQVYSDLQGVTLDFPAPLQKASKEKLPLTLAWEPTAKGQHLRIRSDLLHSELEFTGEQLTRGLVNFGPGKAGLPSQGFAITGQVGILDVQGWYEKLSHSVSPDVAETWPRLQLALQAEDIALGQMGNVGKGELRLLEEAEAWQLHMSSQGLTGELWVPKGYQPRGHRPLTLHIDEIRWPFSTAWPKANASPVALLPTQLPVADVRINRLLWKDNYLGRWQAQLRPTTQGVLFDALQGRWHDNTLLGRMEWQQQGESSRTHLEATVESQDLGRLFRELGLASFIESKEASSQWDIHWQGRPWDFDYTALEGDVSLRVEDAFMPTSDKRTSALRMLGVLNVGHTLGRRLRLDFSDVMKKGLVVDKLTGDYRLHNHKIITTNAKILSPSAEFALAGALDLKSGNIDSAVEVTLPLSSNLYAGCLAGPAACAGIFVVERLWGNRLEKLTSMEYEAVGPWNNPVVNDVNGAFKRKRQQYAY